MPALPALALVGNLRRTGVLRARRSRLASPGVNQRLSRKKRGRGWGEGRSLSPTRSVGCHNFVVPGEGDGSPFTRGHLSKRAVSLILCLRWQGTCSVKSCERGGLARLPTRGVSGARLLAVAEAALAPSREAPNACFGGLVKSTSGWALAPTD